MGDRMRTSMTNPRGQLNRARIMAPNESAVNIPLRSSSRFRIHSGSNHGNRGNIANINTHAHNRNNTVTVTTQTNNAIMNANNNNIDIGETDVATNRNSPCNVEPKHIKLGLCVFLTMASICVAGAKYYFDRTTSGVEIIVFCCFAATFIIIACTVSILSNSKFRFRRQRQREATTQTITIGSGANITTVNTTNTTNTTTTSNNNANNNNPTVSVESGNAAPIMSTNTNVNRVTVLPTATRTNVVFMENVPRSSVIMSTINENLHNDDNLSMTLSGTDMESSVDMMLMNYPRNNLNEPHNNNNDDCLPSSSGGLVYGNIGTMYAQSLELNQYRSRQQLQAAQQRFQLAEAAAGGPPPYHIAVMLPQSRRRNDEPPPAYDNISVSI